MNGVGGGLTPRAHGMPAPPEQMSAELARLRGKGLRFDRAWELAWERTSWPHDTDQRRQWKDCLRATKDHWRSAYERTGSRLRGVTEIALVFDAEEPDEFAAIDVLG